MKKILIVTLALSFILVGINVNADKPFPAPSNLSATAVSSSQINLSWTDNSNDETGFSIERSVNGLSFNEIDTVGANVTSYNNTGLNSNTTYYYKVMAYKIKKGIVTYSNYSNTDSDVTFDVVPAAPTDLSGNVYYATSTPYVYLTWTDNSNNEAGFNIERSTNGINFSKIGIVPQNQTYYYDWRVIANSIYYYKVRASNNYGNSDYSNIIQVFVD